MYLFKSIALIVTLFTAATISAQELFVQAEPASNMPAHSAGIRLSNWFMNDPTTGQNMTQIIPELMWAANRYLMIHGEVFVTDRGQGLTTEGGGLYAKYRFFSKDALYHHFRMAGFGRISMTNAVVNREEIQTNGNNSGYQVGLVATQLLHKTALSFTGYYQQAWNTSNSEKIIAMKNGSAINYSLSTGRLIFPKRYTGYKQVNMNLMVELLGQWLPETGTTFLDIAPSVQFIFNSQTRLDIGYKFEGTGTMQRVAPNGLLLRVEHLLFNVL
jgi:hypothetical protein